MAGRASLAGADGRPRARYNPVAMAERLTDLQKAILEVDALNLTVRDSIRHVTARVGFFVGQQRYLEELEKARAIAATGEGPDTVGSEAARAG